MLKHATITRTSRVQQELQRHWNQQVLLQQGDQFGRDDEPIDSSLPLANIDNPNLSDISANGMSSSPSWLSNDATNTTGGGLQFTSSCNPSPSPKSTPTSKFCISSAPSSVFSSPSKTNPNGTISDNTLSGSSIDTSKTPISSTTTTTTTTRTLSSASKCGSESMIKVFAQTLSQEVEYVTLHVNAQTKSSQIIRSLLRKFRLKHRDPNLFYLTLERWIRKDGLKQKSVMLLSDQACPLQLQQCCSNPPHNDIKFTLQMRAGALIKIHCSDVCPNTRYKCLSLSTQTSVDETIELMLHCLNLVANGTGTGTGTGTTPKNGNTSISSQFNGTSSRLTAGSPILTDSSSTTSSSSSSTTSSSSGIDSDPMQANQATSHHSSNTIFTSRLLDSSSRTNSVTSISSSSNVSNTSSSHLGEQFCLIIECRDTNYRRILESDEYLVDVYQNLLDEARERDHLSNLSASPIGAHEGVKSPLQSDLNKSPTKQQPDQWFLIKLKRREDLAHQSIQSTNPRQNMPLPPIPLPLSQLNNKDHLQNIVSTTQIEVNHQHQHRSRPLPQPLQHHRQTSSLATSTSNTSQLQSTSNDRAADSVDGYFPPAAVPRNNNLIHHRQMSAIVASNHNVLTTNHHNTAPMPPPPASLIWLPPIRPRRRNLSNASTSTFGRPHSGATANGNSTNRRRYDPAQLAEDLDKLEMSDSILVDLAPTTTKCADNLSPHVGPVVENAIVSTINSDGNVNHVIIDETDLVEPLAEVREELNAHMTDQMEP